MELGALNVLHTVFYVCVVRSIGQDDKMEFDEIGQRAFFVIHKNVTKLELLNCIKTNLP